MIFFIFLCIVIFAVNRWNLGLVLVFRTNSLVLVSTRISLISLSRSKVVVLTLEFHVRWLCESQ